MQSSRKGRLGAIHSCCVHVYVCLFACALYCINVYKVKLCIIIVVFYCFIQVTGHDFQHVLVLNIQSLVFPCIFYTRLVCAIMLNMSREVTCVGLCADKMALLSTPRSALIPLHQQRNDASQQLVLSVSVTILYEHDLIAASRFNEYY